MGREFMLLIIDYRVPLFCINERVVPWGTSPLKINALEFIDCLFVA
jgi:hypothetical protein